jgi:hypothetical protein
LLYIHTFSEECNEYFVESKKSGNSSGNAHEAGEYEGMATAAPSR